MNARPLRIIDVPAAEIIDWESFHDVFARVFQFADYYGRNFNARIDLMTYLDLEGQVDALVVPPGTLVGLRLRGAESFAARAPVARRRAPLPGRTAGGGDPPGGRPVFTGICRCLGLL